ncbi:MAG: hypothetical protein RIB47_08340 [Cyclobacteriaceae bacterium]
MKRFRVTDYRSTGGHLAIKGHLITFSHHMEIRIRSWSRFTLARLGEFQQWICGNQMLDHLGEIEASTVLVNAIENLAEAGQVLTKDLGGSFSTTDVTCEIVRIIESL